MADLPAAAWKRLFLVALRRMGEHPKTASLAKLCAREAIAIRGIAFRRPPDMAVASKYRGMDDRRRLSVMLRGIAGRRITKTDLIARRWPDIECVHLAYRQALDHFQRRVSDDDLLKLWRAWGREFWLRRNSFDDALAQTRGVKNPVEQALAFMGEGFEYSPESLKTKFGARGLSLNPWGARAMKQENRRWARILSEIAKAQD